MSNWSVTAVAIALTAAIELTSVVPAAICQGKSIKSSSVLEHKIQLTSLSRRTFPHLQRSSDKQAHHVEASVDSTSNHNAKRQVDCLDDCGSQCGPEGDCR